MIDINILREKPEIIENDLKKRKDKEKLEWLPDLKKLDLQWRKLKQESDNLRHKRNEVTTKLQELKRAGSTAQEEIKEAGEISTQITQKEEKQKELKEKVDDYLKRLPNIMHKSVPYGKDDSENKVLRKVGNIKEPKFELKSHGEVIAELCDFDRATKISGAGFYFLKGELALLNQALIRFAIDTLLRKKYTLVQTPLMMRKTPYEGVTDLRDFENVMYKIEDEDLYLIATSEHPLTSMFMKEILDEEELPIKLVGLSPCFRKEIGSHGVDTRGLFRVHQFEKIEQIIICKPEDSWKMHEELIANAEYLFKKLGIPYRVVNICTGDLGTVAAKKYDIEVWFPKQKEYKEVVSCSNCTDYQARRLNIKYGQRGAEKALVHTLNSTAFATSRVIAAIVENFQQKDGSVTVPKILVPYLPGLKVINKKSS
ncbi:MAG: serine--tRNA ligase [archaeon]